MTAIAASTVTKTYDCKTPGCDGEARGTRGLAVYCSDCQKNRRESQKSQGGASLTACASSRSSAGKPIGCA